MDMIRLGKTDLQVSRVSMGCIPLQRRSMADAVDLLRYAYDSGVNFYDTAHVYTDSEEKIGAAFAGGLRGKVILATKAMSTTYEQTMEQLETSLRRMKTDYIDLYQWHNPANLENFQEERGPYQAMLDAQKAGKIRHIGITNHNLARTYQALESGCFSTVQYPLSPLSADDEFAMADACRARDIGIIAMKAMCGGLLQDGALPYAFLRRYSHIVPIWGVERREELDQFLRLAAMPVQPFDASMEAEVERLRAEYGDEFCRGCGYCLPCPAGIDIPLLMRVEFFVKRNTRGSQFTPERIASVANIGNCINCGNCSGRCPYHLDVPVRLQAQQKAFNELRAAYEAECRPAAACTRNSS